MSTVPPTERYGSDDIVAKLFSNFRELAGIMNRYKEHALGKQSELVNDSRHVRVLHPGEIVFMRMPGKARPPKHLLGEPSQGPYVVVSQSTFSSAKLKDPATNQWVDGGVDIPLEQILAGPKRGLLAFEGSEGGRSIGQMVADQSSDVNLPPVVKASGWKASKRKGDRTDQRARRVWSGWSWHQSSLWRDRCWHCIS